MEKQASAEIKQIYKYVKENRKFPKDISVAQLFELKELMNADSKGELFMEMIIEPKKVG